MYGSLWNDTEVNDLELPWGQFSVLHPERSYNAWWNKRHAIGNEYMKFVDRVVPLTEDDLEKFFDNVIETAESNVPNGGMQSEVSINIVTQKPIAIAFTGDWHIGQRGTDHRTLRTHNKLLAETPGLYVVGMGDYRHNAKTNSKQADALYASIIPDPEDQKKLAFNELRKFKGKILGLVAGCHDSWDMHQAGLNPLVEICNELETACLWHGGVIHLTVGTQTYHILARHKYGADGLNSTNAQRRAFDEYPEDDRLDIICLGHLHYPDMQKRTRGKTHKTVYLRSGSYYIWDDYGQKLAGYKGEIGVPVVILYPDHKKIVPFEGTDLDVAIDTLSYLRVA